MNALAGHLEERGRGFWARVRGADGERELRKRARRGPAIARDPRKGAENFFERQGNADDAGGADKNFVWAAAEAPRRFFNGFQRSGMARGARGAIRVAGIHDDGAHAAFRGAQFCLETTTGAATTRFCVKTAAAEAGTSLESSARSSAPVFFRPQAVAEKRNPRGRAASESACFMGGESAERARRSRKRPPILRAVRCGFENVECGTEAHGLFSSDFSFCSSCANRGANGIFGGPSGNVFGRRGRVQLQRAWQKSDSNAAKSY